MENYLGYLALATGLGLPIAVIGAGIGQGIAVSGAVQGMARQPESSGTIQTAMIIGLALIESLVIYALLMFFILQAKLPATAAVLKVIGGAAGGAAGGGVTGG